MPRPRTAVWDEEGRRSDDTSQTLSQRLARVGAELLSETLSPYLAGQLVAQAQDDALATYAPQLKKEDGQLNLARPAHELERRVRAFTPWPGAFVRWEGQPWKILRCSVLETARGEVGTIISGPEGLALVCGAGALTLLQIQPPGKKPMPAADFARGAREFLSARLN